jgi:NADH:quinone reductase (non-electrogenic)
MVTGMDEQGVDTDSTNPRVQRIDAATKIWAAGVQASPLGRLLAKAPGVELDPVGRVKVETDCTIPGHPEVFVIGDLMGLDDLPGVTQVAIQSGRHAAQTIIGRLAGDTTRRPFRYRDAGRLAMISRLRAVAVIGNLALSGFPAWVLWLLVRLTSLPGLKNRASVLFNWTVAFLGSGRPQRAISAQQVFARQAIEVPMRDAASEPALSTAAHAEGGLPRVVAGV